MMSMRSWRMFVRQQAERTPVYDNRLLVIAKDLDGYVIDVVE